MRSVQYGEDNETENWLSAPKNMQKKKIVMLNFINHMF